MNTDEIIAVTKAILGAAVINPNVEEQLRFEFDKLEHGEKPVTLTPVSPEAQAAGIKANKIPLPYHPV